MHKLIFDEIADQKKRGVLLVLTGPTGAGKDTILTELTKQKPDTIRVITTTSRPMRAEESEGNPYHFVTREHFEEMIANKEFFEWVEFRGDLKGTQKKTLEEAISSGKDIVWRIDAKGVKNIKQKITETVPRSVFVYLTASSIEMLHHRVEVDEGNAIHHRWNEPLVKWEMDQYDDCDYLVDNEDGNLGETVREVVAIMEAKRLEILK